MTLKEAIKRLELFLADVSEVEGELLDDALRLGIETLKRISDNRDCGNSLIDEPLPGETKE